MSLRSVLMRFGSRVYTPDPTDHVGYNRTSWDGYASRWRSRGFRRNLASEGVDVRELQVLGQEWTATERGLQRVIEKWILPWVDSNSDIAEIGVGGGRIALLVSDRVRHFRGYDISAMMLAHAQRALAGKPNVDLVLLKTPSLPAELTGRLDFVYSFDVFVHLDLHTQWKYIQEIARVLKPGGRAFLHTANLTAPAGWERFASQDHYTLDGHYFVTPEVVRTLVSHTPLRIIEESTPEAGDSVLERDYLILLERPI